MVHSKYSLPLRLRPSLPPPLLKETRSLIRILVISPHTDDAELACGATIARWVEESAEVRILHLSDTRNVNGDAHGDLLRNEAVMAGERLGLGSNSLHFSSFPTRSFSSCRQEIMDFLVTQQALFEPTLVVGPNPSDSHQDHSVVAQEITRAFKEVSILRFDTFWNLVAQETDYVVEVHERHLAKKISAIEAYRSQQGRRYTDPQALLALARIRGLPRGFDLAESFSATQTSVPLG